MSSAHFLVLHVHFLWFRVFILVLSVAPVNLYVPLSVGLYVCLSVCPSVYLSLVIIGVQHRFRLRLMT